MQVALYARVSTSQQQLEGTSARQQRALQHPMQHHGWSLLPEHAYSDDGISGARRDRPALDRLRDAARRGEFDAGVLLSPDRLARNSAHPWLLMEEFEQGNTPGIFLHNPFGDRPQGKLLPQMQGMRAEYERAQIAARTRRGRLEKARRGACIPWAYPCYGSHDLPKRHGCAPQVMIAPVEAAVIRALYRALGEAQRSCRQSTRRLHAAKTPTPTGKNTVWQPATVRAILTNRVYSGQARYNYRQHVIPRYRQTEAHHRQERKTGRRYRAERAWVWSDAPAIIRIELFDKAQRQLQRHAATARTMSDPASRRYVLRTLVQCGAGGLGMVGMRQQSAGKKYAYLYDACKGREPLNVGRTTRCKAKLGRADRLDAVVWDARCHLLHPPGVIPHLHQTWAEATPHTRAGLEAQQAQLLQRRLRLARQEQRLLDAYQTEIITLQELHTRRQKLAGELPQIAQDRRP
jgi:site-specific DNA recombinase